MTRLILDVDKKGKLKYMWVAELLELYTIRRMVC